MTFESFLCKKLLVSVTKHSHSAGEVAEWFNAAVLKTVEGASPPRVRISASPPIKKTFFQKWKDVFLCEDSLRTIKIKFYNSNTLNFHRNLTLKKLFNIFDFKLHISRTTMITLTGTLSMFHFSQKMIHLING